MRENEVLANENPGASIGNKGCILPSLGSPVTNVNSDWNVVVQSSG